jgi:5-methylcytosine-specific restriction enzyme A
VVGITIEVGMAERKPWQRTGPDTRIRGREGQRLRQRRLARTSGLCERCLDEGRTTLATVVNHKLPLAHGGEDVDENTENLCDRHDAIVTAQQFGKRNPEERGVDRQGRPTSPDHPWNRSGG